MRGKTEKWLKSREICERLDIDSGINSAFEYWYV